MSGTTVIAFEGIDGSGKTVQMYHLERALTRQGIRVDTMSFPIYRSFFGREVGKYLTAAEGVAADEVDGKSMALWFALDRHEAFQDYCDGAADVLLINRYVLSNAVYQSIRERDLGKPDLLDFVLELEYGHFGIPMADAYIYLDVDVIAAGSNVARKGYREYVGNDRDVYEAQALMQQRARAKYMEYAALLENVLVVPCMGSAGLKNERDIALDVESILLEHGVL